MASKVEHLGGDRWRVRVYAGIDPVTGKQRQVQRSFRANGPRAAAKAADRVRADLRAELDGKAARRGTMAELVAEYEQHMLTVKNWSPTHARRQHDILQVLTADLGAIRCDDLTARHVDRWYATLLGRGLSAQTVVHYGAALRAVLRQGARWDMSTERPVVNATLPTVPKVEVIPPSPELVGQLIDRAGGALQIGIVLAAFTGCRRGEIMGLRWSDFRGHELRVGRTVIEEAGELTIRHPKSGKPRRFTVDDALIGVLGEWRCATLGRFLQLEQPIPTDWYVLADLRTDPTGQTPARPDWLSLAWTRHRNKLGDGDVRFHDLRHWHLSTLFAAGVPGPTVQARGGHADISTTGGYSHSLPEGEETTRGVISRALGR